MTEKIVENLYRYLEELPSHIISESQLEYFRNRLLDVNINKHLTISVDCDSNLSDVLKMIELIAQYFEEQEIFWRDLIVKYQ